MDPNDCRARTPGFEALGGWLKDDGRDVLTSRVWVRDIGLLTDPASHGAQVWKTFSDCAVRSDESQYSESSKIWDSIRANEGDAILSKSTGGCVQDSDFQCIEDPDDYTIPEPGVWHDECPDTERCSTLNREHDGTRGGQRVLRVQAAGNDAGLVTELVYSRAIQLALKESDTALVLIAGGYSGTAEDGEPSSSVCGGTEALCLFGRFGSPVGSGTSHTAPMLAAALDTVWAVWPEMDVLDLRNLAFDCAEDRNPGAGETATPRTYTYKNGRSFTSNTNPTWGHGVFSLTCLFTPNGGLQDPTTGNPVSGGIFGPLAGPVASALITGMDYTGRDFGYGFARPHARENFALAAIAHGVNDTNVSAVQSISRGHALAYGQAAVRGSVWGRGPLRVDLTAAGNALGAAAAWNAGGWTWGAGIAAQPEGVGSLAGSRAFRAPRTASATITAAYAKALPFGFSAHVHAAHWRTLATQGRSLWDGAQLTESRLGASVAKRWGRQEFALQATWHSGLTGSLNVAQRAWPVVGGRERAVWLTWRMDP